MGCIIRIVLYKVLYKISFQGNLNVFKRLFSNQKNWENYFSEVRELEETYSQKSVRFTH